MKPSPHFFLIFVTFLLLLQFESSESRQHHRHSHHLHSRHSSSADSEILTLTEDKPESKEEDREEKRIVIAYQYPVEEQDDDSDETSMSGSVENFRSNSENLATHICLEDEEDIERGIRHLGVKCICPETKAPVCGSDDITYHNRCYLHCRATQARLTYHRYRITLKKFGPC